MAAHSIFSYDYIMGILVTCTHQQQSVREQSVCIFIPLSQYISNIDAVDVISFKKHTNE